MKTPERNCKRVLEFSRAKAAENTPRVLFTTHAVGHHPERSSRMAATRRILRMVSENYGRRDRRLGALGAGEGRISAMVCLDTNGPQ